MHKRKLSFVSILLFAVFLLSCSTLQAIEVHGISIKISQMSFLSFLFFTPGVILGYKNINSVSTYTNNCILLALIVVAASYVVSVNKSLTLNQIIQLCINFLIFYTVIILFSAFCIRKRVENRLLLTWFYLFVSLSFTHYLLAFFVPSLKTDSNGLFGGIKPALFMSGESNWNSNYIFFIYIAIYLKYKQRDYSDKTMHHAMLAMFFFLMLSLSRVVMALFLIHLVFYYKQYLRKRYVIPLLIIMLIIYNSPIPKKILPERYVYDLYDQGNNPRYYDSIFLIGEVSAYNKELTGFGLGTLDFVNDDVAFSGRGLNAEYKTSINVFPVQLYFDFGIMGLILFFLFFLLTLKRCKNQDSRYVIISAFICCCFHMPGYMNFFWFFLGYFYLIQHRKILFRRKSGMYKN